MVQQQNAETKERIQNAAIRLFSQKGFEGTRVNEIAGEAQVTKALIYYYFKNKEDILDNQVHLLLENATVIVMDFVHESVVKMMEEGRLSIEPDRLRFADAEAAESFLQSMHHYSEKVLDFLLNRRAVLRILMLESLKSGKHQNALFQIMKLAGHTEGCLLSKAIAEANQDFSGSKDIKLFSFFFSILPLISFAAYYDDYKQMSGMTDQALRHSFLQSCHVIARSLVSGNELFLPR